MAECGHGMSDGRMSNHDAYIVLDANTCIWCVCVNDLHAMYIREGVRDILTVIFVLVC